MSYTHCATIATTNFGTFLSPPPKRSPSLTVTPHFCIHPSPRQPQICLYGFTCSGHFILMESYTVWSFATVYFHSHDDFKNRPHCTMSSVLLLASHAPRFRYAPFPFAICLMMDWTPNELF